MTLDIVQVQTLPEEHDAPVSGTSALIAARASAAAPADVSADGDAVDIWALRNGAQATVITAAGMLIGGDATFGLDVDVVRVPFAAANAGAIPSQSALVGGSDGTNIQPLRAFDLDSGAGTEYDLGVNLRRTGAGGSQELLGQTTMALSLPVTIASDQTAIPVTATVTPTADTTATGTLGALNAAVTVACIGKQSVGFQFVAGTLNALVAPQTSFDGGVTWEYVPYQDVGQFTNIIQGTITFLALGEAFAGTILLPGGTTHARLIVYSYTAGSSDVTVTATNVTVDVLANLVSGSSWFTGAPGGATPLQAAQIAGKTAGGLLQVPFVATGLFVEGCATNDFTVAGGPLTTGGRASAAAPANVSADGDAVWSWHLRNGAQATVLTAAGALIGGDAANGIDVDVTRVPADPFGLNADAASATGSISAKLRFLDSAVQTVTGATPAAAMQIGGTDGAFTRVPYVVDLDTTAGSNHVLAANLRRSAAGPSEELLGQTTMAKSLPVVIASDQTAVPISGTVTVTSTNVGGLAAHDAPVSGNPVLVGGRASAAAPSDVSADGDATDLWVLRSGAIAMVLTAAGALIGGDAANGLDVDVTRMPTGMNPAALGQGTMAQGIRVVLPSDQTSIPVAATITAVGSTGAAVPSTAIQVGASDGTNLRAPRVFDGDSGAGTEYSLGSILRRSASGGSEEVIGQTTMTKSLPVTMASDQPAIPISAASLPLPSGAATSALQTQPGVDIGDVTVNNAAGASAVRVQGADAHDSPVLGDPVLVGGYASAEAPTDVSADGDAVRAWFILNGAQVIAITDPTTPLDEDTDSAAVAALGMAIVSDARPTGYVDGEVRPMSMTSDGRIRVATSPVASYIDLFGDTTPINIDLKGFTPGPSTNPWGF